MSAGTNAYDRQEASLTVLLILEVMTTFIVSPFIDMNGGNYRWVLDVFIAATAFVAAFVVSRKVLRWLVIFIFVLCLSGLAYSQMASLRSTVQSDVIPILSGLVFTINICWIVALRVFRDESVTLHRIRGAVVIYLNIVFLFALLDTLLATLVPAAYTDLPKGSHETIGVMIYFSLTTITTMGFGAIVPVHPLARSLATLEAVVGQFYVAILIATLVGRHVSHRREVKP